MFEFQVEGMRCGGCAAGVKRAVQGVDPAATVSVDLASRRVQVESEADKEALAAAIRSAGYPVHA
ncbi:MAG: heavy-metal-associated domain-containing protein [Burkholderiales bacterium]|nr:heavy-metal-associated domain-containing protein [Burkholderiales bacterium]